MRKLLGLVWFLAIAGSRLCGASSSGTAMTNALEIDGVPTYVAHLIDVTTGGPDAPVVATVQLSVDALESPALANWIIAARHDPSATHLVSLVTLHTSDLMVVEKIKIVHATVTAVALPGYDVNASPGLQVLTLTLAGTGSVWEDVSGLPPYVLPTEGMGVVQRVSIGGMDPGVLSVMSCVLSSFPSDGPGTIDLHLTLRAPGNQKLFTDWLAGSNEPRDAKLLLPFELGGAKGSRAINLRGLTIKSMQLHVQALTTPLYPVTVTCDVADFDFGGAGAVATGKRIFGTTYPAGDSAEITIDSAAYTVERFGVPENDAVVPAGNQKLALIHARLKNGGAGPIDVNDARVLVKFTDAAGTVSDSTGEIYDEARHIAVERSLAAGAEIPVILVAALPAGTVEKTLVVYNNTDGFSLSYDLTDAKNAIGKLLAPYLNPKDATGSVALETIAATKGTVYPLGNYDVTFTGMTHMDRFASGPAWVAGFHVKNRRLTNTDLGDATFSVHLSAGATDLEADSIYPATSLERLRTTLRAGGEIDIRVPFETDLKTAPASLSIREGDSRRYTYAKPAG